MGCDLNVVFILILEFILIIVSVNAGKDVHLKIHVPYFIKHKHHTNIVFVHKPEHKHKNYIEIEPLKKHHNYNHHYHQYNYAHTHNQQDDYHEPGYHFTVPIKKSKVYVKPNQHSYSVGPFKYSKKLIYRPKQVRPVEKPVPIALNLKNNKKNVKPSSEEERYMDYYDVLGKNLHAPLVKEHYSYSTSSPFYEIDENNKLKEINRTLKQEYTKIETVGDFHNDVENIHETDDNHDMKQAYHEDQMEHLHPLYFHPFDVDMEKQDQREDYGVDAGYFKYPYLRDDENVQNSMENSKEYADPGTLSQFASHLQQDLADLKDNSYGPHEDEYLLRHIEESGETYHYKTST